MPRTTALLRLVALLLLLTITSLAAWEEQEEERTAAAAASHATALQYVNQGDYRNAVAHFRLTCRLSPLDSTYWNDLGVTEMRLGELHKAKRRFLKALELDPESQTAQDNASELKGYMGDEEFNRGVVTATHVEHHLEDPVVMSAQEFEKRISLAGDVADPGLLGSAPIVIRGAAQSWGWSLEPGLAFLERLQANFGDERADFYPHNMADESVHPFFSSLSNAIDSLLAGAPNSAFLDVDVSQPGTYIQWNVREHTWRRLLQELMGGQSNSSSSTAQLPAMFDDTHWTKQCFETEEAQSKFNINVHWKMLLVGEAGAGMFNHKDVLRMASWQVQIAGRKRWHLCGPSEEEHMSVHMNTFYPDYASWPQLKKARCIAAVVGPGDALYYPRDWWHQTENLDTPTVALSGSMVNHHNHAEFAQELFKECEEGASNRIFVREEGACNDIRRCADAWSRMYHGGREEL